MLEAEETACSIGRVICVSICSGPTLGHCVETATIGRETRGSRSIGRRVRQMNPSSTSEAIRMLTATGRSTEIFAMDIYHLPPLLRGVGVGAGGFCCCPPDEPV